MKNYRVKYKGNTYANYGYYFLSVSRQGVIDIKENSLPLSIDRIFKTEETDTHINFYDGDIIFDFDGTNAIFKEVYNKRFSFNKETLRAEKESGKLNKKFTEQDEKELIKDFSNISIFLSFISKIIDLNDNIKNHIKDEPSYIRQKNNEQIFYNFYNMIIFNLPEYERIINSNNVSFLEANLNNSKFEILEANKLHQVVGLPKFAIKQLKDLKLEELTNSIKDLSNTIDGNSLKIFLEFLESSKLLYTSNFLKKDRIAKLKEFIDNMNYICKYNYKITNLLSYLLRQSYYYCNDGFFSFPLKESMFLKDYIRMCEKYNLKYDRYPNQLKKIHDIIAKNIISLEKNSDITENEFKKSVLSYAQVEQEITITLKDNSGMKYDKVFKFIVPKCIRDIIEEGNDLNHCVGSYADNIIEGISRIVFMREKEKESLVTIDIDSDYNLIEAKKSFNEDVTEEQSIAINKWLKNIKKLKKTI